ncbi:hypothetical protein ACFFKF_17885 [Neobacillus cucumis]
MAVSEVRVSSDRRRQGLIGRVRSLGIFGQKKAKSHRPCPKSEYLRTEGGKLTLAVSEVRVSSNRRRQNLIGRVRSQSIFGQKKARSHQLCPKSEYLWTEGGKLTLAVSEVRVSSDRRRQDLIGRVRSQSIFGQKEAN